MKETPKRKGRSKLSDPSQDAESPAIVVPVAPVSETAPEDPPFPKPDSAERLSFKIVDGKLDLSSMQARTAEKAAAVFQETVKDPTFRQMAGLAVVPQAEKPQIVTPKLVGGIFDGIAQIETTIFTKKYQLPREMVAAVCAWTPQEHIYLDAAAADLLNKYIPESWLKYADVGMFCATLLMMIQTKMSVLNSLAVRELERMRRAGATEAPTPSPVASTVSDRSAGNGEMAA